MNIGLSLKDDNHHRKENLSEIKLIFLSIRKSIYKSLAKEIIPLKIEAEEENV